MSTTTGVQTPNSIPLTPTLLSWFAATFITMSFATYYALNTIFLHSPLTFHKSLLDKLTWENKLGFSLLLPSVLLSMAMKEIQRNPAYWLGVRRSKMVKIAAIGANIVLHFTINFVMLEYLERVRDVGVEVDVVRVITGVAMTLASIIVVFSANGVWDGLIIVAAGLNANVKYLIRLHMSVLGFTFGLVSTAIVMWPFFKLVYDDNNFDEDKEKTQ